MGADQCREESEETQSPEGDGDGDNGESALRAAHAPIREEEEEGRCTLPLEQSGEFVYFGCEGPKGISGAASLSREQKQTWVLNLITPLVRDRAKQENQEDNTHSVRQRAVKQ